MVTYLICYSRNFPGHSCFETQMKVEPRSGSSQPKEVVKPLGSSQAEMCVAIHLCFDCSRIIQASLKCSKDEAAIIEDVYSCIRANAQQLSQFPELVPQLCLNEPDISYCATLAKVSQFLMSLFT